MFKQMKRIAALITAGIIAYSSAWATTGWQVDSYGNIKNARSDVLVPVGFTTNCMVAVSGSTVSIVGNDGNALSATNRCTVGLTNATAVFTSPQSFTFGTSSDTSGESFGITTSANWSNNMPFILQVVSDGTTGIITGGTNAYFMLSRIPRITTSSSGHICQKTDSNCTATSDIFIVASGLTLASWASKPTIPVGWIEASFTTAGKWAFTLASPDPTGFNFRWPQKQFTYPTGQNSARSGSHWNTSNAPIPGATLTYLYSLGLGNELYIVYSTGTTPTNGGNASAAELTLPLDQGLEGCVGSYFGTIANVGSRGPIMKNTLTSGVNFLNASAGAFIANNSWTNSNDNIGFASMVCFID